MKSVVLEPDNRVTLLFLSWRDIKAPKMGGAELYTHEMMVRSDRKAWRIIHFSPGVQGLSDDEVIDGIRYLRAGGILSVIWKARRFYKVNRERIRFVIDQCNSHRFFTRFWVPAKKRVFFIHQLTREIWTIQAPFPIGFIGRLTENPLLKLSRRDPTIAVSPSTKQDLLDVGFSDALTAVIPEGLDFEVWPPERWLEKADPSVFVYVGRYSTYKGIDVALQAYFIAKKTHPSIRFWVLGKRNEDYITRHLAPLCKRASLTQAAPGWNNPPFETVAPESADVIYWGFVSEQEKLERMSRARLLIFPSIREGWGLIISEAAAVGTPSVVFDAPGSRDAVDKGNAGYLCETRSPECFARQMILAIEDTAGYEDMRSRAHRFASVLHWDRTGAAMDAFFNDLLNGREPGHSTTLQADYD